MQDNTELKSDVAKAMDDAEAEKAAQAAADGRSPVPTSDAQIEQYHQIKRAMPTIVNPELKGPLFMPNFAGAYFMIRDNRIMASVERPDDGPPWFHVSLSNPDRPYGMPTHHDMELVREAMFRRSSVVVQVFPPASEVTPFDGVLHLWERLGKDRLVPELRPKGVVVDGKGDGNG